LGRSDPEYGFVDLESGELRAGFWGVKFTQEEGYAGLPNHTLVWWAKRKRLNVEGIFGRNFPVRYLDSLIFFFRY
jgi:hypothetical protein